MTEQLVLELVDVAPPDDFTDATSCRFCGVLTTVAGLDNFEHGPDSPTCARMLARYGAPQEAEDT